MASKNKLKWNRYIAPKIVKYAQNGLIHQASDVYTLSEERTPIDEGYLSLGARIETEGEKSDKLTVVISYGATNESKDYAVLQHENLAYNHPNGGQAKFLESAYEELLPNALPRIRQYIRDVIL